jgi:hypothetical protein
MLQRQVSILCILLLAVVGTSGAQAAARADTAGVARATRSGTWSATNGSVTFMGTWTAVPDTTRGTVSGTWALANAQGETIAYGGWAAAKSAARWTGNWRANVAGRPGEYSGTWSSSIDLKAGARFVDLFEKAAQTIVSGTWKSGARSGTWSIRATK